MRNKKKFAILAGLTLLLALIIAPVTAQPFFSRGAGVPVVPRTNVQILAINDFHGNLEPPSGTTGGVEYLATHINTLRSANPNTVVVSAGDMIGASPLLSALFHDEPTIEAFNQIGLDYNAVGNHEFDEGAAELLRMQNGGCHPVDGCLDGDGFAGANFQFLAANVVRENGKTIFPAYKIRNFNGAKVAFIGMTLEGTPTIVTPSGVAGLSFRDEADTVNALIRELRRKGVRAVVVLLHEGGIPTPNVPNGCPVSGAIVNIVNRTSRDVDLFITGHTHQAYNCLIDDRVVTSASSFGRLVTEIQLTLDRTGEVEAITANNLSVTRDVARDNRLTALIDKYKAIAAPLANRSIGAITADITRTTNPAGESALGDVIADSQLAATTDPAFGGAVVAFMNPGGIRANLTYAPSGTEAAGVVTYSEAFTVQPFGNSLVTLTLTGAQIDQLLEQQFDNPTAGQNRILQVSNGFTYTWSASAPVGSKVDIASIQINGTPIAPNATYRVTVNNFLADGGDNFRVLREGSNRLGGAQDLDALERYLTANQPVAPGSQNRITVVP